MAFLLLVTAFSDQKSSLIEQNHILAAVVGSVSFGRRCAPIAFDMFILRSPENRLSIHIEQLSVDTSFVVTGTACTALFYHGRASRQLRIETLLVGRRKTSF